MAKHCKPGCGHVHFSTLKHMAKSPAHYKHAAEFGQPDSAAMSLGAAVHALMLEGGEGVVFFDGDKRGNAWKEFKTANAGMTILSGAEWDAARGMTDALLSHPRAVELLAGAREVELNWTYNGKRCHGRVDSIPGFGIVELKTTTDANPWRFQRTAERLGYFAQIPWYIDGARLAGHEMPDAGFIVAVESRAPYVVQTFQLTPHALDLGSRQWRSWFERMLVCEAADQWPGYQETDAPLDLIEDLALTFGGEPLDVD